MHKYKTVSLVSSKIDLLVPCDIQFIRHLHFGEILRTDSPRLFASGNPTLQISCEYVKAKDFVKNHLSASSQIFSKNIFFEEKKVIFFKKVGWLQFGIALEQKSEFEYKFVCTEHYKKYIREKIGNVYPLGIHISDLLQVLLLQKNAFAFYGASFLNIKKNEASLMVAPSGTGKTYSLLQLIENPSNYKVLGEEITYTEWQQKNPVVYSTPNTSYSNIQKHTSIFGWRNLFSSKSMKSLSSAYTSKYFASTGCLKRIYILERSSVEGVQALNFVDAFQKISAVQKSLFSYESNPLLQPFFYTGIFSLFEIEGLEKSFFEKVISSIEVYRVRASQPQKFAFHIQKIENA